MSVVLFMARSVLSAVASDAAKNTLRYALSFLFPEENFDDLFLEEVMRELSKIDQKLWTILKEPQVSSKSLLRDAFIAVKHGNGSEANELFKILREKAREAFGKTTEEDLEGKIMMTGLQITTALMIKCYDVRSGEFAEFVLLDKSRQAEIAETVIGYLDDLLETADKMKAVAAARRSKEKVKETLKNLVRLKVICEFERVEEARKTFSEIDRKVDPVLVSAYPLISHALGLAQTDGLETDKLIIRPRYLPVFREVIVRGRDDDEEVGLRRRMDLATGMLDVKERQYVECHVMAGRQTRRRVLLRVANGMQTVELDHVNAEAQDNTANCGLLRVINDVLGFNVLMWVRYTLWGRDLEFWSNVSKRTTNDDDVISIPAEATDIRIRFRWGGLAGDDVKKIVPLFYDVLENDVGIHEFHYDRPVERQYIVGEGWLKSVQVTEVTDWDGVEQVDDVGVAKRSCFFQCVSDVYQCETFKESH